MPLTRHIVEQLQARPIPHHFSDIIKDALKAFHSAALPVWTEALLQDVDTIKVVLRDYPVPVHTSKASAPFPESEIAIVVSGSQKHSDTPCHVRRQELQFLVARLRYSFS